MNAVRSEVDHTRALVGPGNPVPADAFTDGWRDPAGQATYQAIITAPVRDTAERRTARRRPVIVITAAVAVVGVAAGLLASSANPAATGRPVTAPMLRYSLTGVSRPAAAVSLPGARSLLLHLAAVAAGQPALRQPPGAGVGYVRTSEWYMSTAISGGTARSVVIPEVEQTWSAPDGAVRQVQRQGRPLAAAVSSPRALRWVAASTPARVAGYAPGQAAAGPPVRALSVSPARLRMQLLRTAPYDHSRWPAAYHLIRIITALSHQVVPPALEAAVWRVLAGQPGMQDLGTVTDRAGRAGDAVAFTDPTRTERLALIISPASGRLLGWEDMFLRNPGGLSIRTYPAVTGYISFLAAGWTAGMTTPAMTGS
jgi:hypothetical protein